MTTPGTRYLRFAALGDSSTFGLGDPVVGGWRGWARLLAEAMEASSYDVSLFNVATPGATANVVVRDQLAAAVSHRPDLASLIVGINDVLKSTWDPGTVREDLLTCAEALTAEGATLLTARFHDHSQVLPLPGAVRTSLRNRVADLNAVWDEVHAKYGGVRVDLGGRADYLDRQLWAIDRMHPSERGHRCLARAFASELRTVGLEIEPPAAGCSGGLPPSWRRELGWIVAEGAPWIGRRARDLGPWAARRAWREIWPPRASSSDSADDEVAAPVGPQGQQYQGAG